MGIEMALMGAMAVTSIASAVGNVAQGMSQHGAYTNQAIQSDQQAQLDMQAAMQKVSENDYEANATIAKIRSGAGAAGVDPNTGSAKLVATTSAEQAKISDMYTRYTGRLASVRDLYAGEVARWQGNQALIGGYMKAGGSLLGGLTQGLQASTMFK